MYRKIFSEIILYNIEANPLHRYSGRVKVLPNVPSGYCKIHDTGSLWELIFLEVPLSMIS